MPGTSLVVDDEPAITEALAALLDDEGFRVRHAYDSQRALDEIAHDSSDLVISDVMMPLIDGLRLTRHLCDRGDRTPVVLMRAAYADVNLPDVRFVPKPFDLAYILHVVGRVLDESEP